MIDKPVAIVEQSALTLLDLEVILRGVT